MTTLFSRIAWFRAQQYIARHSSYRIAVAGTYGRTLVAHAIYEALKSHKHVRLGYSVQDEADIPLSLMGTTHETSHRNILKFLMVEKKKELIEKEPDTIITDLPLLVPGFAPSAAHRIVPRTIVLHRVASEHLDRFIRKEDIEHEYEEVVRSMGSDARAIVNADDEYAVRIAKKSGVAMLLYGRSADASVQVRRAIRGDAGNGIFIEFVVAGKHYESFLPHLFAKEHVSAVACAVACAYSLGVPVPDALRSIAKAKLPHEALHMHPGMQSSTILTERVECPEQMLESIKSCSSLPNIHRKIYVLADIDDLGASSIALHKKIGEHAAHYADTLVCIGEYMKSAQTAAMQAKKDIDTHHFATAQEAADWLPQYITPGDVVYIAGGKSMRVGSIVEEVTRIQ